MTDSVGAVVERYRYDAYGKRTVTNAAGTPIAASTIGQQRGFTGYYEDAETALYYARSRMYSAKLGRFIQRDKDRFTKELPSPKDGYRDGFSLYGAYFIPNALDSLGTHTWLDCHGWWLDRLEYCKTLSGVRYYCCLLDAEARKVACIASANETLTIVIVTAVVVGGALVAGPAGVVAGAAAAAAVLSTTPATAPPPSQGSPSSPPLSGGGYNGTI